MANFNHNIDAIQQILILEVFELESQPTVERQGLLDTHIHHRYRGILDQHWG